MNHKYRRVHRNFACNVKCCEPVTNWFSVELGPVDISWHPELCGGEGEKAEEGDRSFVVAGGDAAELLEPVEHALDAVAVFVGAEVAGDGHFAVGLWRDDRQNALEQQAGPDVVAVVALVGQHQLRLGDGQFDQVVDGLVVGGLAARENETERASLTVGAGVDFARKAAAASTKALLMSPPFAPAA